MSLKISSFDSIYDSTFCLNSTQEISSLLSSIELQHGVHLNQWRSGKQDLVALRQRAVPTNTLSDSSQRRATATNSIQDERVCATFKSTHPTLSPTISTLNPTTTVPTTSVSQKPLLFNSTSKMSDKFQISKEPGVCVETGCGRSTDPSPRPPQKQYSNSNGRKQQNRTKGNYGNSKGKLGCARLIFYVCVCVVYVVVLYSLCMCTCRCPYPIIICTKYCVLDLIDNYNFIYT